MSNDVQHLEEIEFDSSSDDEKNDDYSGDGHKIFTSQADPEIDSLYSKFKRGRLIIQPDFQRHFVWDVNKSSRLIESVILRIPIPVIYLSQEKDGKEYVIDGQQRLTSFISFIDGKLPDGKDFKLTGLKVFKDFNRKRFSELPEEIQDQIRYYEVRTITFLKESDPNLKFEIFERLNTGSVSLNDQELRNCIYRGPYNILLRELSQNTDFRSLLGLNTPDKRMNDIALVLRFASFYHATYLNYKPPMRRFLNIDMEKFQHLPDHEIKELKEAFKQSVSIIKSLFANNAFKRFYKGSSSNKNGNWEPKKFNASIYDVLMYSFARVDKNKIYQNLDSIREAFIDLMVSDQEFIDSIELSTSSLQAVTKRFDKWRLRLDSIVGVGQKEQRCFSLDLKSKLYKADPKCSICKQKIQSLDDAAVDHIKQYWLGGETIPENARLTHRFCNWARARKE